MKDDLMKTLLKSGATWVTRRPPEPSIHPAPASPLRYNRLVWYAAWDLVGALSLFHVQEPTGDWKAAWEVFSLILKKEHAEACREFNRRFPLVEVRLPLLEATQEGVDWITSGFTKPGTVTICTIFPPGFALWLMLSEPEVCERVRQCPECHDFFLDPTKNGSKIHCGEHHTSKASSREYNKNKKQKRLKEQKRRT